MRRAVLGALVLAGLFFAGTLRVAVPAESGQRAPAPQRRTSLPGRAFQPRDLPLVEVPPRAVPLGTEPDLLFWKGREAPGPPLEVIEDLAGDKHDVQPLTPTLSTNFEGIPDTDWFPPDTILAAGPNHLIEMVNSSLRISTKTGTNLFTTTLASWWSPVLPGASPFDPKVLYDQHSGRWVMVALDTDFATYSWYLLATSWSSDPMGNWCGWALDGSTDGTDWADFPGLGVDNQAIYITSNQFSFSGTGFQYAKLSVLGKAQLYNNSCGGLSGWQFWEMTNADGSFVFTLQPAHTFGAPGKEYLVNSRSMVGSNVTLWSLTDPLGNPPTLTREATVPVGAYTAPPLAEQPGTTTRIHTGDARLLNAVYRDGSLYTGHTVTCSGYSCIRYLRLDVSPASATLDAAFGATGTYYYYPAMMPDAAGNILTVFSRSSPSEFAGARYASWRASDGSFQPSASLKAGEATYVQLGPDGRNRWGDYSGIALDPANSSLVWIGGEFADSPANTWGTWVGAISEPPPGTSFTLSVSKTGPGSGTVTSDPPGINCGADCTEDYPVGTVVTLTATAAPGVPPVFNTFAGWGGDCTGVDPCVVTMDAAKNVSANFITASSTNSFFKGKVKEQGTGLALAGATVEAFQGGVLMATTTADAEGKYKLAVNAGTYDLTASHVGHGSVTKPALTVGPNMTKKRIKFKLAPQ